jgi:hypothetical protein
MSIEVSDFIGIGMFISIGLKGRMGGIVVEIRTTHALT